LRQGLERQELDHPFLVMIAACSMDWPYLIHAGLFEAVLEYCAWHELFAVRLRHAWNG
jgi:hypothetical protein